MHNKFNLLVLAAAAALGCSDHKLEIGRQLIQNDPAGGAPIVFNITDCSRANSEGMTHACVIDATGKTYTSDGTLHVLPVTAPYGAYLLFEPGFEPRAADLDTEGDDASISAWAAPVNLHSTPCCVEGEPANRIAARASLTPEGGVLVTVRDPVPAGWQVVFAFDFAVLYRSRVATPEHACELPTASFCAFAAHGGYVMRFYVGHVPASTGAPATPATPGPPAPPAAGACLLSYNTALTDGDPCCYRQGGVNTCDTHIACNERSGGGCCTIYGTENTAGGGRCCLYEKGSGVDGAAECAQLLSAGR